MSVIEHRRIARAIAAARFGERHRAIGLVAGAALFFLLALLDAPAGLSREAWLTLAVAVLMAAWWASEAVPVAATALLPLVAFPLLGIAPVRETASAYAHPLIFLFMGGFLVAQAMQRWNLHRRIALGIAVRAGGEPARLIAGFMAATAFLSMWVSNTATTIMMLPIAASVIGVVLANSPRATPENAHRFGLATMLAIAFGANIGGIGTLIGTPPNALFAAFFQQNYGISVSFVGWMAVAIPLVIVMLPLTWLLLTRVVYRFDLGRTAEDAEHGLEVVREAVRGLGRWSQPEIRVGIIFAAMAAMWLFRPLLDDLPMLGGLSDPVIAIGGALVLFLVPAGGVTAEKGERLLDWDHAKGIAWDVLVLFGGGLALADAFQTTGLAEALGTALAGLDFLPGILFVLAVATLVTALTQLTSNTATVAALLPIIAALAAATGTPAMVLSVAAVMAASCAFMLPVATPPNAIVFASGYVTIPEMICAGLIVNLASTLAITAVAVLIVPLVLG